MTRWHACLIVCLLWAGIYLPRLGALDLKGEEPRRALPAIHMLQSGDWLVPRVGAAPYLSKPPLLNWLIAVSFWLGGIHEWTARLPSALAVLALGLVVVAKGESWLGRGGVLLAAVFCLTNIAFMETGRLAELEAVYCSFTGIAFVFWITAWLDHAGPWRLWLPTAVFLALAMLEKGPAHLLCFYAVVIGTLACAREWRVLRQPAHLAALAIIFGSFAAWAVPCARAAATGTSQNVWGVWAHQLVSHSATTQFHFRDWIQNIPRGLAALLPWTVFLPLLWRRGLGATPREAALFDGARIGTAAMFVLISLLPAASPRYIYPLISMACLLLARVLNVRQNERVVPAWVLSAWRYTNLSFLGVTSFVALTLPFYSAAPQTVSLAVVLFLIGAATAACLHRCAKADAVRSGLASGVVMVLITGIYAVAAIPRITAAKIRSSRQVAAEIRQVLPANTVLWIQESTYRPFWYYLEPRVRYFIELKRVPCISPLFPAAGQKGRRGSGQPQLRSGGGARARLARSGHRRRQQLSGPDAKT